MFTNIRVQYFKAMKIFLNIFLAQKIQKYCYYFLYFNIDKYDIFHSGSKTYLTYTNINDVMNINQTNIENIGYDVIKEAHIKLVVMKMM